MKTSRFTESQIVKSHCVSMMAVEALRIYAENWALVQPRSINGSVSMAALMLEIYVA